MNRSAEKRTPIQTPARSYVRANPPPTEPNHGATQKQSKIDRLAQRQDVMYSLAGQVGKMGSHYTEQNSIDYTYEQSFREAQRKAEDLYEEQMQNLENDKINLIKRLNLALVELDRVTQDKTELGGKDLQRRLEKSEGFSGMVANNLKSDIGYQHEQNEKLRGELTELEREKSRLTMDTTAQGNAVDRCREDAEIHRAKLRKAEDDLRNLQDAHNTCVMELKAMVERAEELVRRERGGEDDKDSLKSALDGLVKERSDLIFRMNNLTEKYELYVKEMTKEREETIKSNKNRTKLLTASTLFSQLIKRKNQRMAIAMERIKRMAGYHQCLIKCAAQLALWHDDYKRKLMGLAFRRWWHTGLSWTQERGINNVLLQREHDRRQRAMLFCQWQNAFRELSGKRDTQFEAARRAVELNKIQQEKNLRRAFDRWLRVSLLESRRDNLLHKSLLKMLKRQKAEAFLKWMALTRHNKETLKAQRLANEVAMEQFKRQMFSRFRHNLYLNEDSKVADAQVTLNDKYTGKQKGRFMKACTILFMRMNKKKGQQAMEEGFQSMKFNVLTEKKDRTKEELNKEQPEVAMLEKSLKKEIEDHKEKRQHDILAATFLTFKRKLHYYFERWWSIIPLDQKNAATLKKIFNHFGSNRLANGFHKWRQNAYRGKAQDKQTEISSCNDNISGLNRAIRELETKITQQKNHWQNYSLAKLQRIAHIIARRFLHNRILQWRDSVAALRNVEKGGRRLARTVRRHTLSSAFNKYREEKQQNKKEEGNKNKIAAVRALTERNAKKKVFQKYRAQIRRIKGLKNVLRKIFRDKDKDKLRRMLNKWRGKTHNVIRERARVENEKRAENNEKIIEAIEENETLKRRINEDINDLGKREDNQGTAVIVKNLLIWQNRRLLGAFKIWRNNTHRSNSLQNLLVRYVHKKEHNNYRAAFDSWRTAAFVNHIKSINDELKTRIGKYNTFTKLSTLKLGETAEELKELKEAYAQIKDQNETDKRKIESSTQILDRLQRFCIRFAHDHNYLLAWIDMIHREKALQGRAKLITQTYVGKHIYAKLKQVALQNMAKNNTEKKWTRALRIIARSWLRKGFKGIKEGTTALSVTQKEAEIQNQENILEDTNNHLELIKERSCVTHEKEILRRRLLRAFWAWQRQSDFQRLLKKKTAQLNDTTRLIKLSGSFGRWRNDVDFIERDTEKGRKAIKQHDDIALNKAFKGWHKQYIRNVTLPKALNKLAKRQILNNVGNALEQLHVEVKDQYQEDGKKKTIASQRLGSLLTKLLTNTLSGALSRLLETTESRSLNNSLLRRIFLKILHRKLEDSFNTWRLKAEEHKLIDDIELKGTSAKAASEIARRHSSFVKFLHEGNLEGVHRKASIIKLHPLGFGDQSQAGESPKSTFKDYFGSVVSGKSGYMSPGKAVRKPTDKQAEESKGSIAFSNEELEVSWTGQRQQKLEDKNKAMRKLLLQWQNKVKGKDITGNYIYFWRRWLRTKKNIKASADLVLRRLYNGEKAWAFDKLRNLQRAGIKAFEKAPRNSLINTITASGLHAAKLNDEAKVLGEKIAKARNINEKLEDNYTRGKTIAVTVVVMWLNKPLQRALDRWKLNTQKLRIADLEITLQDKKISLRRLEEIHEGLEMQNNHLLSENEDLRQASIDGLEIANTIQRMTQEREQLSIDLADRSLTVKKLLEENVNLQTKLDKVKEEAENLMKLSKEII